MELNMENMPLIQHVLLPVATVDDARETCRAVRPYLSGVTDRVTVVTVVERSQGWPDIVPKDYRVKLAEEAVETARRILEQEELTVEIRLEPSYDTPLTIHELAEEVGATSIVFTPRSKGRLVDLFTGDTAWQLIKKARCPVIVVPPAEAPGV